ncbi:nucleotidyltransferase domain-containing protein [Anaeromicropila populeti]|uniref:Nucleotidyltransferase domain-containing protein n=1 Tax=Anaeromicropila populeti TaxID=37658 RepID=A0A1I6INA1_9FIRM|nr:nucleotidyltransferase domain-containing protein [Anaeromicropila populeti]SFR68184.1 Nucleotidyltransferase domain-containing protein [Anaeromicropila populeti]
MLKELQCTNEQVIAVMKEKQGVLGAWNFGSASHGMSDEYSDIDIIFLVDSEEFCVVDESLTKIMETICDNVIVCWPENFNSDSIKNYGFLLRKNEQIFQYDVFLINNGKLDDFMCKIHYTGLQAKDIIFERESCLQKLIQKAPEGELWNDNLHNIIQTYWFHVFMTKKYFARKDFFKMNGVLRILMDTHTSLLLTGLDKIKWGGSANKLHFIEEEKQKHLMKYGCIEDFAVMKRNLLQSMTWFEEDVNEICDKDEAAFNNKLMSFIKESWIHQAE